MTMLILAATAAFSFGEVKVERKDPAEGDIDHPNIAHSRYLPTDACLLSIRAGTN